MSGAEALSDKYILRSSWYDNLGYEVGIRFANIGLQICGYGMGWETEGDAF